MAHLFGRRKTDTVPSRPAIHLGLRAAAESQQLCPELFDKVEQACNRGLLLFVSTAKGQARNMNVQAAGAGGMAKIPHALCFTEYLFPRHFVQVVLERHGMRDKFQALIQTAIGFDVQVFGVCVGNVEQLLCVAVHRAALVNFQLYAKVPQALAVEHKIRCIVVVVNRAFVTVLAVRAIGMIVVEVSIVAAQDAAAVVAADIVLVKTALAERVMIVLNGAFLIDAITAAVTGYCQTIYTVLTEPVALYLKHFADRVLSTAVVANSSIFHFCFLHSVFVGLLILHGDNI